MKIIASVRACQCCGEFKVVGNVEIAIRGIPQLRMSLAILFRFTAALDVFSLPS